MACGSCGKSSVQEPTYKLSRSDAVALRNEKQGYKKAAKVTPLNKPQTKAQTRSAQRKLLLG